LVRSRADLAKQVPRDKGNPWNVTTAPVLSAKYKVFALLQTGNGDVAVRRWRPIVEMKLHSPSNHLRVRGIVIAADCPLRAWIENTNW